MATSTDFLFRTLADPTRRALFERLCRDGEQTVAALTAQAGVSQPAVSKHLAVLKQAGLVSDRPAGRQTHYSAQLGALAPLVDWTRQMTRFWESRFDDLEDLPQEDGPMTATAAATAPETLSVVVEREIPFAAEKIWRALTQPHLLEEWLMKNDFKPVVDHRFKFTGDWGAVDCQVQVVEPNRTLAYTWDAMGLKSTVTWTLTPKGTGTHLRMEQAGFKPDQQQAYQGAKFGWQKFFANLETVVANA